ncbi:amino acid adenylation domain-containing protein, partial [Pseudoalteromonas luteoviolacea]|uniref:non-ribosomal peptide synthetase n=1 Tax=Pseudoalteromonas luteoviolacea TaxID=43657 RepID=UPI001B3A0ECA
MNKPRTRLPLSLPQSDIFWDQLRNENSPVYNVGGYIKCRKLDIEKITRAHEKVVNGNDAFGIRVNYDADEVYQYISDERDTDLAFIDFSAHSDALTKAKYWLKQVFESPVPFIDTFLFKTWLVKVEEDQYWYVAFAHHLMMDGWGFSNWAKEISRLYNQCTDDESKGITPLALNTVVLKDQEYQKSERYLKDRAYWQTRYHEDNSSIIRANYANEFDHSRACPSRRLELPLSRDFYQQIKDLSQELKVSISHILLGVLSKYFSSAYSASSLCFGIPVHNRRKFSEKKMIGVFTGVNPFNVEIEPGQTFRDLVSEIARQQKSDFRHQRYPISHISRDLGITAHGNAVYEIMFNFLQLDYRDLSFDSYQGELNYVSHNHNKTPLVITLWDGGAEKIELQFEYSQSCFVEQEVQALSERILLLLQSFLHSPDTLLSDVDVLMPAEKALLLTENQSHMETPLSQLCTHEFFEARASLHPDQEALRCNGTSMTYGDLNCRANQLAHYLKAQGVKPDNVVGVCVERSLDMVVAILAILKAGGAYLPLDPDYPESRLAYMVEDSCVDIVLTQTQLKDSLPFLESRALCLDNAKFAVKLATMPSDNLPVSSLGLCAEHLAYLIYTSGSTGRPKGVMVEHRNTAALLTWALDFYSRETLGCVLASTSMCFDLSIFEMFAPLAAGGSVLIVKNILDFSETDDIDKVTLVNTVPSAAQALLTGIKLPAKLRTINLAGEALKQDLVDSLYQAGFSSVYDLYGPSEDTTYSTCKLRIANGRASIGTGIANTQLYVLTPSGQLAPKGVSGELYIGGAGLARGYLNRPKLNDEKFVANPFYDGVDSNSSKRLYRTGDLVRWLPCGELEYLGRLDHQVKIRGFRVELGEIEHVLTDDTGVREAVVLARETAENSKRLVGYLVIDDSIEDEASFLDGLRSHMKQVLPEYMVPSALMVLESLPLTANGKLDRNALPEPEAGSLRGMYVAPQTKTEKILCRIWQEVLELEQVGIQDNFFELGGHSLQVTKLVARIGEACEVTLS